MKPPEFYGWTEKRSPTHRIIKSFQFKTREKLSEFIVGLLEVRHEPNDPHLEAIENKSNLSVQILLNLNQFQSHEYCVKEIVSQVEQLFKQL